MVCEKKMGTTDKTFVGYKIVQSNNLGVGELL
jgi:hypothetical protein